MGGAEVADVSTTLRMLQKEMDVHTRAVFAHRVLVTLSDSLIYGQ